MQRSPFAALLAFVLGLSSISFASPEDDVAELFVTNCASCHGEKGDGDGWTQLDRRARSFKEGGFSYGNTVPAIVRTLTHGIPGTPMPSFDGTLSEEERTRLAEYVRSLGPPITEVDVEDTILTVGDRPAIVRGLLPALTTGAESHPRGLLIGTPDGLSFEYRTDDVRLLGVRQGRFVERADWTGRGGAALKPLGKLIHARMGGRPGPLFFDTEDTGSGPLRAHFAGTWIRGSSGGLRYRLEGGGDESQPIRVSERCRAQSTQVAAGFERSVDLAPANDTEVTLKPVVLDAGDKLVVEFADRWGTRWHVIERASGFELFGVRTPKNAGHVQWTDGRLEIELRLRGGGTSTNVSLKTLLAVEWTPEIQAAFLTEVPR